MTGPDGSWVGQAMGVRGTSAVDYPGTGAMVLRGIEAYAGWTLSAVNSPGHGWAGVVYEGEPPPFPERPAE